MLKENQRDTKALQKVADFSHYNAGFLCYKGNQGEIEARLSEQRSYLGADELLSTHRMLLITMQSISIHMMSLLQEGVK